MSKGQPQEKLKVLCLHGYLQNAEIFKSRIGSLRKALKSRLEFVFINGPFESQGLPGQTQQEREEEERAVGGGAGGLSWWQWTDTGPSGRPSKAAHYTGWPETERVLLAALDEHRPDLLLGFSQGATAVSLLLASLASSGYTHPGASQLKGGIAIAGFVPRDPAVAAILTAAKDLHRLPCLFVSGAADVLVPPERIRDLTDCFPPALVSTYSHGGAHLVPTCSGEFKACLVEFIDGISRIKPAAPLAAVSTAATSGVTVSAAAEVESLAYKVQASLALENVPAPIHRVASDKTLDASKSSASLSSMDGTATASDSRDDAPDNTTANERDTSHLGLVSAARPVQA